MSKKPTIKVDKKLSSTVSNFDLFKIFGNKANCMTYKQLAEVKDIDKLVTQKKPYLFLLYEYEPGYGHWTSVIKQGAGLEFFDSYGTQPDEMLKDLPRKVRSNYGMEYPALADLLHKSKKKIMYNNHQFQMPVKGVNTCGKWCAIRAHLNNLKIDEFAELFGSNHKQKIIPDAVVARVYPEFVKSITKK